MNNIELTDKATIIWNKLFCIQNENKTKEEQVEMIKSVLIDFGEEQRKIGRTQIINYMESLGFKIIKFVLTPSNKMYV